MVILWDGDVYVDDDGDNMCVYGDTNMPKHVCSDHFERLFCKILSRLGNIFFIRWGVLSLVGLLDRTYITVLLWWPGQGQILPR